MNAELKERLARLVDESDETGLACLQHFIQTEEDERGADVTQGYSEEENEAFYEECDRSYQDYVNGKEPGYSLEELRKF